MKKIGTTIIESNITNDNYNKERTTVRGVIIRDDKVFMLYSQMFDDYTFPGGGVKQDEEFSETLKRELLEEIGASDVTIKDHLGYTEEIRFGISGSDSVYKQLSHYYLCDVNKFVEPIYAGRELNQGLKGVWVNIDDAIKHNEMINNSRSDNKGFETVLVRENIVLKHIKETL